MPQVSYAPGAIRDLQRLREFLRSKNPDAARRAVKAIRQGVRILGLQSGMGRPAEGVPEMYREWLIDFGDSGYVVRYRVDADSVTLLAVWHQKEAGL
ncbi:MAG: type II toxin-antitoxin system RelE/ParE family toxin [Candidatus Accumulibacter sp.]|jgi:plasmid stabilization system protein ParE|nr:type II toxin-antitoxin system RelE/ParE family toxin [Accumulibacter sp.]